MSELAAIGVTAISLIAKKESELAAFGVRVVSCPLVGT
jgi:hypothetical protein